MENVEFRWLQGLGQPPQGAIMIGGPQSNLWQVLQFRTLEGMRDGAFGEVPVWSDWQNLPVAFERAGGK